jgi:D-alanyl-D-alanine carboxypeptidase/D-alanyl-D-alanine-endopeptidase (penicillin-binding protein 4)
MAASVLGGHFATIEAVPDSKPTLESKGSPLSEIAKNCLQPSDNYLAESLLMMAASSEGQMAVDSYSEAAKRMRAFLTYVVKLDPNDADPYDGSGLSRHDNLTATGIVKLLTWAKKQPWASVWETALAAPGVGTLKNRLKNTSFKGKTGTLNKVSSLSGYVKCKDGRELVVSILVNHYLGSSTVATKAQDEIVEFLASRAANGPKLAKFETYVPPVPDTIDRLVDGDRVARSHLYSGSPSARACH